MAVLTTAMLPRRHAQTQSRLNRHLLAIDAPANTISAKIFPNHASISQKPRDSANHKLLQFITFEICAQTVTQQQRMGKLARIMSADIIDPLPHSQHFRRKAYRRFRQRKYQPKRAKSFCATHKPAPAGQIRPLGDATAQHLSEVSAFCQKKYARIEVIFHAPHRLSLPQPRLKKAEDMRPNIAFWRVLARCNALGEWHASAPIARHNRPIHRKATARQGR